MKSLTAKTVLWASIPTMLVLVLVGVITLFAYERVTRDAVQQWNAELVETSAGQLAEVFRQQALVLQMLVGAYGPQIDAVGLGQALERARDRLAVFNVDVVAYDRTGIAFWSRDNPGARVGKMIPVHDALERVRTGGQPIVTDVFADGVTAADVVMVAVPIETPTGEFDGLLTGLFEASNPLPGSLHASVMGLQPGTTGFAYLVDGTGRVVYHPDRALVGARLTDSEAVVRALRGETGSVLGDDVTGERIVAGFAPVPGTAWGLIVEEEWRSIIGPIRHYSAILLGIVGAGGVLSTVLLVLSIGRILTPIRALTRGARRIAGGDFDHEIVASTGDEIQVLAEQFNTMASALKDSYADLEMKVDERTRQERRRAEQLRLINEIGRKTSSILSLDELLPFVTSSLHETFGYDYVIILLHDAASDELLARASSQARDMTPRDESPRVRVTEGITGWVFRHGEPLLVPDVSQEPRYLLYLGRPDTKSELAVPISIGAEAAGVLDIESTSLEAFDEVDVLTAQTVADQVAIAIENARLSEERRDLAVIEERNRMAREIHDTLAQGFTGIVLQLEAAEEVLGNNAGEAWAHIERARSLARKSLNEARRSVWDLRPQVLERLPLHDALGRDVDDLARDTGIRAALTVSGEPRALPADVENALLRACQESLANVRRHARATQVKVRLAFADRAVRLTIRDDGIGFAPTVSVDGAFGLVGMRERARLLGGTLRIESELGKGTRIDLALPIPQTGGALDGTNKSAGCR